jgi:lactoylglutathione lyase
LDAEKVTEYGHPHSDSRGLMDSGWDNFNSLRRVGSVESHIYVSNLVRAAEFYEKTLKLEFAYAGQRRNRFYWIGKRGQVMLGLWEKEPSKIIRKHFAFQTSLENMREIVPFLKSKEIQARNFLDDGTNRPFVFGWMPALSIYINDPDGHSLEFISMLPDEPKSYLGVLLWEEWEDIHGRSLIL